MGNVSADGRTLWLSGRYDNVVYVFDTTSGDVRTIAVGKEPHGLTVWPQPGRYSLGHTGNLRTCPGKTGSARAEPTTFVPPMYGCRAAGTSMPPSAR